MYIVAFLISQSSYPYSSSFAALNCSKALYFDFPSPDILAFDNRFSCFLVSFFWFRSVVEHGSDKPFRGKELLISRLTRLRYLLPSWRVKHSRHFSVMIKISIFPLTYRKHLVIIQGPYSYYPRILVLCQVGYEAHSGLHCADQRPHNAG